MRKDNVWKQAMALVLSAALVFGNSTPVSANIFTTFYKFLSFYRKARIYHSHFEDKDNVIIMSSLKKWF